jgi:hypothetical protein
VEEAENDARAALRKSKSKSNSTVNLRLLNHDNESGTERGLVLWSGFLYGQPMSVPPTEWPKKHTGLEEFCGLEQVYKLSLEYDHYDAQDASIDGIRNLLYHGHNLCWKGVVIPKFNDVPQACQMLVDFVVYGEGHGDNFAALVDANIDPIDKCDDPMLRDLLEAAKELEVTTHKDLLRVSNEIIKKFLQKGKDERAGIPAPDLMARCRYHAHAGKGQPCYLDK